MFVSLIGVSQDTWVLLYENDAEGQPVLGKIDRLINAVRGGEAVRIYYNSQHSEDDDTYVEHTTLAKFITIMNSPDGPFVTAQIDPIIGQTPNFKDQTVIQKENLEWSLIASTTGKQDHMMRNAITGEILGHSTSRWGVKWFVQKNVFN